MKVLICKSLHVVTYCLHEMSRYSSSIKIENRSVVALGWELSGSKYEGYFRGGENVVTLDCGDGYTTL